MKRLLCGVLALMLLMLGTCIPALAEKLVDSGDVGTIHWELDSKGKLTVTGTGKIEKVPAIDYYAKKIKSIEIGDEITEIEFYSFSSCNSLEEIVVGEHVQQIDESAFRGCQKVRKVIFQGKDTVGDFSFIGNMGSSQLKEIIFPDSSHLMIENNMLFSADRKAIYYQIANAPKEMMIPEGVEVLGSMAFIRQKIQEVYFPSSLRELGICLFEGCNQLKNIYFIDISKPIVFSYPGMWGPFTTCSITNLTLPPCVPKGYDSFWPIVDHCNRLKTVALGEGTLSLGYGAINGCSALEKVYLPQSIENIYKDAIEYSPKLTLMVREGSYAETFAKENGFKYAYFTPVSGITLSEQALTLKKGKSVALTAEIAPADATEQTLIWCSSDPKVATVTKGKVKAVGVGSCEIICYASDGSNTRTVCTLTVEK